LIGVNGLGMVFLLKVNS
jgi:hypothetical protein